MELLLLYAAVFIAGLIVFDWIIRSLFSASRRTRALNHRLRLLEKSENNLEAYQSMLRERGLNYDRDVMKPVLVFRRIFAQSGLKLDWGRILVYGIPLAGVVWFASGFIVSSLVMKILFMAVVVLAGPMIVILRARTLRTRKFVAQLPGALDVINRSLMSGHPLPTAIALVSRELPDPVGTEFGMLSDELTYGIDLDEAMQNMIERVGAEDLKLLAISMSVQRGTGGNFVEILENLAHVIRDRAMLRGKVKALSAEGRITAMVMSAFPFLLYFMINALAPSYFEPIWESGYANAIIAVGITIMLIGNIIIYRLVNFDF